MCSGTRPLLYKRAERKTVPMDKKTRRSIFTVLTRLGQVASAEAGILVRQPGLLGRGKCNTCIGCQLCSGWWVCSGRARSKVPVEMSSTPSLGHPAPSCTVVHIVGLKLHVYGLDEIKGSDLPIAAVVSGQFFAFSLRAHQ